MNRIVEIFPDNVPEWAQEAFDAGQFFRIAIARVQEAEGKVLVAQTCPICDGGPVVVRAECKKCKIVFVGPEMSRYNKTAIAKAKE